VQAEKHMYRRFGALDPFLMTGTVIAMWVAAAASHGRQADELRAGAVCFTLMLAITLLGNMPINLRIFRWDEAGGDPDEWRMLRRRWDRLHSVRIVLDLAGFALAAAASAFH
jgi:hypothetical protein